MDADIDSFDLYHDVNGDGAVDGGDSLLGSATFSSRAATVTGLSFGVGETSKKLLLVLDIASSADPSHVVGLRLTSNSFITVSSGSVASTNFPIANSNDSSLPVLLSLFTAEASHGPVTLKWRTESETNNLGFHIYRSGEKAGEYVRITPTLIKGHGTDATPHDYSFLDETAQEGQSYWYLIEDVDFNGVREQSDPIEVRLGRYGVPLSVIPTHFVLYQNFPNPFNPETWISYELAADVPVSITIYDTQGNRIRTLSLGTQPAGSYRTKDIAAYWDGRSETGESVSSGVYFYYFQAGGKEDLAQNPTHFAATKKMLILK